MIEIKPLIAILGAILIVANVGTKKEEVKTNNLYEEMLAYEKYLDSCIIYKSALIGSKAIKKDSSVKVLSKVCSVLKTEVKELKIENKELKSEVTQLASKPADTVVKTIYIKKKIFGGEDTLD